MKRSKFNLLLFIVVSSLLFSNSLLSQVPDCNTVYLHSGNYIYNYNPTTNTTTINSITMPSGASGLAVADNFFGVGPNPTFYTVVSGIYRYWNGTAWTSTGHSSGSTAAVNPGGAGPYIYNVDGINNRIYQYDGNGNSTLFITLTTNGPYDCMGDANGNLYVINGNQLRMYDVNGNLACSYTLVGYNNTGYGGGYGIVNGIVYANNGSTTYKGVINGSNINFTPFTIPGGPSSVSDFANCAFPPLNATITYPGDLSCSVNQVDLTVSTTVVNPTYTWSGPGIISGGSTSTATVNQPGSYTVDIQSTAGGVGGCANSATSTVIVALNGASNFTGSASCVNNAPVYEGTITVSNDMNTGTMTISSACGGSQTFNLPITSSAVVDYQFTGTTGGPADCDISVTFSDYPSCNQTVPVANPNCCAVDQPVVNVTAPTCSAPGEASLNNYNATYTYSFSPAGPTVNSSGQISGFAYGTDYTVSASDGNCTVPSSTFTVDSTKITPTVSLTNGTICIGDNTTLTANVSPNGGTYSWSNGLGSNSSITVSPTSATTYSVTYDLNGCTNSASATIDVDTLVIPVFGTYGPICQGNPITLPTSSNNGVNGTWSPSFNADQTTTYTFTPSANQCADTQTTTVVVKGSPDFNLQYTHPTVCDGTDGSITITGLDPNTNFNVNYNNNPATTITSDNSGIIILDNLAQGDYQNITVDWNGCVTIDTSLIQLKDPDKPRIDAGPDQIVCPGVEVVLIADNPDNATIFWDNNVINGDTFVPSPINLFYTVTAEKNGCIVTDSVSVFVDLDAAPTAQFVASDYEISNVSNQVYFMNLSSNAVTYSWNFGDGNFSTQINPEHQFDTEYNQTYYTVTLYAYSDLDCVDSAIAFIQLSKETVFFVPNTFTPDGDQYNNTFKPIFVEGYDANEYSLLIFDRWGEIIFESHDPNIGWDGVYLNTGKIVPDGSYTWKIEVKVPSVDDRITQMGSVTLMR